MKKTLWWSRITGDSYSPMIYEALNPQDKANFQAWADEIETNKWAGESGIPFMSLILAMIDGNYCGNIIQLGHFRGYSTLLIGFYLRKMGLKNQFISCDVSRE